MKRRVKSYDEKLDKAMSRLRKSATWLICRGTGKNGYGGSITSDLKLVLDELEQRRANGTAV